MVAQKKRAWSVQGTKISQGQLERRLGEKGVKDNQRSSGGPSGDSEAAVTPCAAGRGHPWSQAG